MSMATDAASRMRERGQRRRREHVPDVCGWDLRDAYQGAPYQPPVGNQSGDVLVTTGPADRDGRTDPRTE
jgi:hypothetical protein